MVAQKYDDIIIHGIDENPQGPKMQPCAKFYCSTPDHVGAVYRQTNKQTNTQTTILCIKVRLIK